MPTSALWTLVGSLILLALGLTFKWVENSHGLKLSEKEVDRLRSRLDALEKSVKNKALSFQTEIDSLKKAHDKEISDLQESNNRDVQKLMDEIDRISNQTHTVSSTETKYITTGPYKWKITVLRNGSFGLDKYPICARHDLKFIHGQKTKQCPNPECKNKLDDYDSFHIYETVKSIVERHIRNGTWDD